MTVKLIIFIPLQDFYPYAMLLLFFLVVITLLAHTYFYGLDILIDLVFLLIILNIIHTFFVKFR